MFGATGSAGLCIVPQCGNRCLGRNRHNPSASGAKDDSPPFQRGPRPAPLLRGLGWLNRGWRGKESRVPPGTTQNSVLEFAVILHDGSGDVAWTNVSLKPVAAKPRFHIRPPQYVPPELIEFVRKRVRHGASRV